MLYGLSVMYASMAYDCDSRESDYCYYYDDLINANELPG